MTSEERLERIERKLDAVLALLGQANKAGGRAAMPAGGGAAQAAAVASDSDLDGTYGNPVVRLLPKRWEGEDFKGRNYADCDPDFLDMLAEMLEYFATRDDEQGLTDKNGGPKSKWSRLDASRARGWSRRLRSGGRAAARRPEPFAAPPPSMSGGSAPYGGFDDGVDDIPF